MAKDGVQLVAVSRVTVRTNLDRLVGGAGAETIIARVGEGMVSTIGSAKTHKDVLENPEHISKHVFAAGLDAGTVYEILSIDIADVDVGENIGAKLQIAQATRTSKSPRRRPRNGGPWPWRSTRRCARAWWRPRPTCREPWRRPSGRAISVL